MRRRGRRERGWRTLAVAVHAAGLTSACSSSPPTGPSATTPPPPPPPPAALVITGGNAQTALAGEAVASAPRVRVTTPAGDGVPGVFVSFSVISGGGSVEFPSDTTDSSGSASPGIWTLGSQVGTQQLRATAAGLGSATFSAVATAGAPDAIVIAKGDAQSATAGTAVSIRPAVSVRDGGSNPVSGISVTFSVLEGGGSITGAVVTTNAAGIAEIGSWTLGTVAGANRLQAASNGLAPITITATGVPGPAASVAVEAGDGQSAAAGTPVPVAPAVRVSDAHGNPVAGVPVTFAVTAGGGSVAAAAQSTGPTGIATVGGWTLGTTPGANGLRATVAGTGIAGSPIGFVATGTAAGSGPAYDIEIRYNAGSSPTGAQLSAFASAETKWESLITGDLPPVAVNRPAGTCSSSSPISETVDDLVIFVTLEPIDGPGGVLGTAGPCLIRFGTLLPVAGTMRFDTADLATLESNGLLDDVVLHEMGHVLGIGTLWGSLGFLADPAAAGGVDPHFTGPSAISAFNALGGSGYGGAKVPVEAGGGAGTQDGHWRESVLDRELMTGWIDAGSNPLSLLTASSLDDLGYTVDSGAADAFGISISPSIVPRAGTTGLKLEGDMSLVPIEVVDPGGRPVRRIPR